MESEVVISTMLCATVVHAAKILLPKVKLRKISLLHQLFCLMGIFMFVCAASVSYPTSAIGHPFMQI